ncbi:MAG: LysR family transcriptional regulator [Puniceicoccales bacterium]|jgi:DNA-binding transcriptional LysR family regulator|nr:LysR family transcriptional regulator [Puniceicoccales bacterium]
MHIENFKIFADLIKTKSFSKTGKQNGLSQSAVSQQLRALELSFNVRVLDRSQKRFHLTREGERIHAATQEILRTYDRLLADIQEMRNSVNGSIRVSTILSIGLHEMPNVLRRILVDYPSVNICVEYRRSNMVLEDVEHNGADLGLLANPDAEAMEKFAVHPFAEDKLAVICSPRHPFAVLGAIPVEKLSGQRFISFDRDIPTQRIVEQTLLGKNVHINTIMETDNIETIKRAVEAGIGIALVPASSAQYEIQRQTLAKVDLTDAPIKRSLVVIHRKDFVLSPAMKKFIQFMVEAGKEGLEDDPVAALARQTGAAAPALPA